MKKTLVLVAMLLAMLTALLIGSPAPANADPPNCETIWFPPFQDRTICDGPIRAGGSWIRARQLWSPGYQVPLSSTSSRYSTSCYGGYWQPEIRKRSKPM